MENLRDLFGSLRINETLRVLYISKYNFFCQEKKEKLQLKLNE